MTYNTKAFAKVNLHLEVLNKRSDLFHNIFCFNASLDFYDRISLKRLKVFKKNSENVSVKIQPKKGEFAEILASVSTENNLITRAAKAYFKHLGKSAEIIFTVEKNIPAGAGLGGGSSDAAAVLRLLNRYFSREKRNIPDSDLIKISASLGADIPYCIAGGYAFSEGTGDIIERIEGEIKHKVLLVFPDVMVNTGNAYALLGRGHLSKMPEKELEKKKDLFRQGMKTGDFGSLKNNFYNDFEEPVFNKYPVLRDLKGKLLEFKPDYAAMTGSGSCLFGLFPDITGLKAAEKSLKNFAKVIVTKFI